MLTLEILIPFMWLIVIAILVAACIVSARGDESGVAAPDEGGRIDVGAPELPAPEQWAHGEAGPAGPTEVLARKLSWV